MKKRIWIYCLFLIGCFGLQAQTDEKINGVYQSFIMDGTCEWLTTEWYDNYYKHIISAEEVLIQEKSYHKVFYQECRTAEKEYAGAIREDNKRIYYMPADGETEILLYDFNMEVGDCISYYSGSVNLRLARIDIVQMEGEMRRRYYFCDMDHDPDNIYPYDSWIEGVGSEQELLRPFFPLRTCQGCNLRVKCVHQDGKVLYRENIESPCSCENGQSIQKNSVNNEFRILKNPIENKLLSIELKNAKFFKMDIYFWDGNLLLTKDLSIGNNGILEVPLMNLQAGSYILIFSRPDGSRESAKIVIL